MMAEERTPSMYQRNAFAPALLAAAVLLLAPVLVDGNWSMVVLFVVAILPVTATRNRGRGRGCGAVSCR